MARPVTMLQTATGQMSPSNHVAVRMPFPQSFSVPAIVPSETGMPLYCTSTASKFAALTTVSAT